MIKKTLCLSLLSAAVLVSVPLAAMAHPDGYGRHHGGYCGYYADQAMPDLSKEQLAQMDKLCEEHRNAVRPLYDQLSEKGLELRALSPNPNVKPEEIKALTAEIAKLHEQIRTVNNDFYAKMTKAGIPCRGYHHGGVRPRLRLLALMHLQEQFHGEHGPQPLPRPKALSPTLPS